MNIKTKLLDLAESTAKDHTDLPATIAQSVEYIEQLERENEKLTRRNALIIEEAEREGRHNRELRISRFRQFSNEDCWIYGGDEHDNLESLACPVVMQPQQLMEILQELDQVNRKINELVNLYDQQEIINPVTWRSKFDIKINQLRQKAQESSHG